MKEFDVTFTDSRFQITENQPICVDELNAHFKNFSHVTKLIKQLVKIQHEYRRILKSQSRQLLLQLDDNRSENQAVLRFYGDYAEGRALESDSIHEQYYPLAMRHWFINVRLLMRAASARLAGGYILNFSSHGPSKDVGYSLLGAAPFCVLRDLPHFVEGWEPAPDDSTVITMNCETDGLAEAFFKYFSRCHAVDTRLSVLGSKIVIPGVPNGAAVMKNDDGVQTISRSGYFVEQFNQNNTVYLRSPKNRRHRTRFILDEFAAPELRLVILDALKEKFPIDVSFLTYEITKYDSGEFILLAATPSE